MAEAVKNDRLLVLSKNDWFHDPNMLALSRLSTLGVTSLFYSGLVFAFGVWLGDGLFGTVFLRDNDKLNILFNTWTSKDTMIEINSYNSE